ncbi:hypothetical protein F7725_016776 [Dissostichus mawsoni]|uniref:Core Histone H2A/H2B/H3 domain-containing protein n=1 Tax=Dissostichus mawsoni TaxID=36200 RepID=A0A7J5Z3F1_DISMA|nr:hypothetical protein F7725_016776 [Dissostichus mawsoni]
MVMALIAGLTFPVGRIHRLLKKGQYAKRIGNGSAVYLAAVLEYLCVEILELAGNACRDNQKHRITPRHILLAVKNDEEINTLLAGVIISEEKLGFTPIRPHPSSFFVDVTESDPCWSLSKVKVFDQEFDQILFPFTVDRHQVASLGQTVELCISPAQTPNQILGRYKSILKTLKKTKTMTRAFHKHGIDRNTVVSTSSISELAIAAHNNYQELLSERPIGETVLAFAKRCEAAIQGDLPVGGDFDVQGQLDVHQLLVFAHLAGHVLLGSLQSILQVSDAEPGIFHCQLTTLLCLCDLSLKAGPLWKIMSLII